MRLFGVTLADAAHKATTHTMAQRIARSLERQGRWMKSFILQNT